MGYLVVIFMGVLGVVYLLSQTWLRGKELDLQRRMPNLPGELEAELLKELKALREQNQSLDRRLQHVETILTADPDELTKALRLQADTGTSIPDLGDTDPAAATESLARRLGPHNSSTDAT